MPRTTRRDLVKLGAAATLTAGAAAGPVAWRGEWLLYYGQGDAGVGVLHGRA